MPYWPCAGVSAQQLYNAQTNPGGTRCSIADLAKNLLGPEKPSVWTAAEKQVGHGFAGLPFDNVGVQYGLAALRGGAITPAQFVDLNAHIGGADVDLNPVPQRRVADQPALATRTALGLSTRPTTSTRRRSSIAAGPTRASRMTPTVRSRSARGLITTSAHMPIR